VIEPPIHVIPKILPKLSVSVTGGIPENSCKITGISMPKMNPAITQPIRELPAIIGTS
jgi:hypothetical protein